MKLKEQRKRLNDYLNSIIFSKTLLDIARSKLSVIHKLTNREQPPSESEVYQYVQDHFTELHQQTGKAIDELVKEILPDETFVTKMKNAFQMMCDLGILSALLLPVLYVCTRYSLNEYKSAESLTECADGVVSRLFVLLLLGFSIHSYFKNK